MIPPLIDHWSSTLRLAIRVAFALAYISVSGCALLSKNEPLAPRYFTLSDTPDGAHATPRAVGATDWSALALRLGRVSAGAQSRERILYRSGDHEVAYYNDRRWAERPEVYLRRALMRTLFEERGLQRVISGAAPVLQAELITFEEIRGDKPRARMQVLITLDDGRTTRLTEIISVERPVQQSSGDQQANAVARAFGEALRAGVEMIADHVTAKLQNTINPGAN
ncbi:MAG: membrane integrity-associated transporter subunit PqiC [Deltaproteobacteria bacterium]|nr:membrane integrity-associated transporter subunit PqiC [Deltaproteobacteria bacterium]